MLRQRRAREGCSFTFRGSHTTSHDLVALPLEDEEGQPSQVLWCRWAPPARTVQRQAIHTSGSWSLVRPKDPFQQTEVTAQPGADAKKPDSTHAGDEAGTSDGTKGNVGDKTKAPEGPVASPPAKKRQAEQRAIPVGLSVKVVPGDGNCLYSSFAQGLAVATGKESVLHHLQLRAEVVQHFLKHADSYSAIWDREMPDGTEGDSFEAYVEAIATPGTWSGLLEIRALARMYDCRITIVPRALTEPVFTVKPAQKQRIIVLLFTGIHFDTLLPEPGKSLPKAIKDVITEPPKIPMRGGGGGRCTAWTDDAASGSGSRRSSCKRSRQTVWTEPPESQKRKSSASRKTVWTQQAAGSKKAASAGGCNRDVAPTIATDALQVDADLDAEVAPAIRRPVGGPRTCQWAYEGFARCRLCPYKIPCAGNHDLKVQKVLWGHYHRHHPGQTHTGKAKGPWASLVTPLSDDQEVAWRCKFCTWGIILKTILT